MTVTRTLCASAAAIALISAFCIPSLLTAAPPAQPATLAGQDAVGPVPPRPDEAVVTELPPFKPVARVSSLMVGIGSAFSQLRDVLPRTSDEHRLGAVRAWSEVIAELSNVHTQHRRKPSYLAMAADTRSLALELASLARSGTPDEAQMAALVVKLDNSCTVCHDAQN